VNTIHEINTRKRNKIPTDLPLETLKSSTIPDKEYADLKTQLDMLNKKFNNIEKQTKYLKDRVRELEHNDSLLDRSIGQLQVAFNKISRIFK
jgi:predicted  nucleic acid-binding Zn-ribbon protein